jgi:hypothetical protein
MSESPFRPGASRLGAPSIEAILSAANSAAEEAKDLKAQVVVANQARRRENRIYLMILGVLGLFVALSLFVSAQNYQIAEQTRTTNERLADCTTPTGKCYRQGQARTGSAVADILKASVYMAECSRLRPGDSGPEFDAFLERCVAERIVRSRATPAPSSTPTP